MRNQEETILVLQRQLENELLKGLLDRAQISYEEELSHLHGNRQAGECDSDQGARIRFPPPQWITDELAKYFFARFRGRTDVYALRYENAKTGQMGYQTQCKNLWNDECPRTQRQKIRCADCAYFVYKELTVQDIREHLLGRAPDASDVVGVYPLLADETCKFLVFDFDNHDKGAERKDFANEDDTWIQEVEAMREICILNGIDPLVERSRSGRGAHIWIFFQKPYPAYLVRSFGMALLEKGAKQVNLKSFRYYDRMFPAQDHLPKGGLGNLIALPLQGKALREGNSAFIDENWDAYPDQWSVLWSKAALSQDFLEQKLKEWVPAFEAAEVSAAAAEREKPWEKSGGFCSSGIEGIMQITLADGIYIDTMNLKPILQNQIRRLAAFSNPTFYKNQAMGYANFGNPRWLYYGQDHPGGYIELPRGLYDTLTEKLDQAKIPWQVTDERQAGRSIDVEFKGELKEE